MTNNKKLMILLRGIIMENPVLILILGTCPTLATTTSVISAFSMGLAATVVLIGSNVVISALRKIIPDTVRIPCYIVIIAAFVTAVQMLLQAYIPNYILRYARRISRAYRCKLYHSWQSRNVCKKEQRSRLRA